MQLMSQHAACQALCSGTALLDVGASARSSRHFTPQTLEDMAGASTEALTLQRKGQWLRSRGQRSRHGSLAWPVAVAGSGNSLEFSTAGPPGRSCIASVSAPTGAPSFRQRLEGLGLAGVVAYGILNTLYYTAAFFFVWKYIARVPRGLGLAPAAAKFAEVIGITWVGSQATKVPRAAGAVVLAPAVDTLLNALQRRAQLRSKRAAFLVVLTLCIAIAGAFYGSMLLVWA